MKSFIGCGSFLLVALAELLFSPVAQAEDWFFLTDNEDGSAKFFLDRASISRNGSSAEVVLFTVNTQVGAEGEVGFIAREEYDCQAKKRRSMEITLLYADQSTRVFRGGSDWSAIQTNSIGESVLQNVCIPTSGN